MAKRKTPDYAAMSLAELDAAAGEHYAAIRALRDRAGDDPDAADQLARETEVAVHRAHLAVINPLRTEKGVQEELKRSQIARVAKGMSRQQWAALHQALSVDEAAEEATVHEQGAG